ncbi:hypothetical protein DMC63_01445 [Streptomyces sp. WAC 05977]|nr:hypothetical protein DMC63_01445 [Streptomyces sp. WAC 05977]
MTDQTETAGARDAVIDLAARVVHQVVSKELGTPPGSEPSITDVVAVQELARRGLLVPVELFDDRERERAELRQARADYQQRNRQLFERTAQRDKALRERNALERERDQLTARIERLRSEIENTTLPVGALQQMSDAVNLVHPVSEEDDDVPYTELRARRAMDLVYDWLRSIRAIPAALQGDQPAEPEPRLRRDNLGAVSIYFGPNGERVAYDETKDRYVPAPTSPSAVDSDEDAVESEPRFPYRQMPHELCGSNSERQSVGDPGHCEDCCSVGHVVAHPDLGCGDVGCYRTHGDETDPPAPFVPAAEAFPEVPGD